MNNYGVIRIIGLCILLFIVFGGTAVAKDGHGESSALISHGKYVAAIAGCNDCHTPGYTENGGKTPLREWLSGSALGWNGPWGTTYPPNLRIFVNSMTLKQWLEFARTARLRPPMPYWALNTMTKYDLTALYALIHSLGPTGKPAPAYLPPGVKPKGAYVTWVLPAADKKKK